MRIPPSEGCLNFLSEMVYGDFVAKFSPDISAYYSDKLINNRSDAGGILHSPHLIPTLVGLSLSTLLDVMFTMQYFALARARILPGRRFIVLKACCGGQDQCRGRRFGRGHSGSRRSCVCCGGDPGECARRGRGGSAEWRCRGREGGGSGGSVGIGVGFIFI